MKHQSTFSIVICNYNYQHHIEQAIESVIGQNYPVELFEIIVVDDGSTDESLKVIQNFSNVPNVKIIKKKNGGQASAYYEGIKKAKNDWVCLLDSDDYYKPQKLAVIDAFIQKNLDALFICSDVDIHYEKLNKVQSVFKKKKIKKRSLSVDESDGQNYFTNPGGQAYKRELIQSVTEKITQSEWVQGADVPISWGALFVAGKFSYLHESLAVYRVHGANHFINSHPLGKSKVNVQNRLPNLINYLFKINKELAASFEGGYDRTALIRKIQARVQPNLNLQTKQINTMAKYSSLITFITTCKNRLEHLKLSLPKMLAQPDASVVVVDYGCEQGTSEWVKLNYPQVKIIRVDDNGWNVSRARNLGAELANSEWLFFIDADVILQADIISWFKKQSNQISLFLSAPRKTNLFGTCIIKTADFKRLGGYDEAFRGWGGEDTELYDRIVLEGLKISGYPSSLFEVIEHGDDLRAFGDEPDQLKTMSTALRVELLYRTIKQDIKKVCGSDLDLSVRVTLMQYIKDTVKKFEETKLKKDGTLKVTINDGLSSYQKLNLNRTFVYNLKNEDHRVN